MESACVACGAFANLQCACGIRFCGASCQKASWPSHKSLCASLRAARADVAQLSARDRLSLSVVELARLAECHAAGLGCDKNLVLAKECFALAAARASSLEAAELLFRKGQVNDCLLVFFFFFGFLLLCFH